MNEFEFVNKLKEIESKKTLYCLGGFGQPLYKANQQRLIKLYSYNKKRKALIEIKDKNTYAFDCIGLIKAVLWGWTGKNDSPNGGATYKGNNVPDASANQMIKLCKEVSVDFDNIQIGEFVWMEGHCGIYIGDDQVIESSPKWLNGVQISGINGRPIDGRERTWTKHGKLPYIAYSKEEVAPVQQVKNLDDVALRVYNGEYGNAPSRYDQLKKEGYTDEEIKTIQNKVNKLAAAKTTTPKTSGIYYTVVAGDSLFKIANKYNTTVYALLKLNPTIKNPNLISVGQKLRVK